MELKSLRSLLTDTEITVDISKGIHWIVAVDSNSCDEIFKMITLINDQDFECEVYGLMMEESEEAKNWVKSQGIKITCFVSEDPTIKEMLGLQRIPWFTCVDNSKVIYSMDSPPMDLRAVQKVEEDLTELRSPVKKVSLPTAAELNSVMMNSFGKSSVELPNTSLLINKQTNTELERALKKIEKLTLKVKEQEQIIDDYKAEMRQLRLLLAKNSEVQNRASMDESPIKSNIRSTYRIETMPKNKPQQRINQRVDENEFWKIEESDDMQGSIKFEDIAASKDLWLMGLFRQKESPKPSKIGKVLPPLQAADRKKIARSMLRDNSYKKNEKKNSSNLAGNSSRKLIKNH